MKAKPIPGNNDLSKILIQWSLRQLSTLGYTLKHNQPETIQNTPWSYVARFATSDGTIYLKQTPELLALEAPITQILYNQFNAAVPTIIAYNPELHCFLMKDAGQPLRAVLKQQFDERLLSKAIEKFTSIQLTVVDHIEVFLELGVPDWRLNKLPDLFKQLLNQKKFLMADGLSETELVELESLLPTLTNYCKKLSNYAIKETLVQCDFHDNNILIAESSQAITFIDLGEIVISHPFFSLVGCLRQAKRHHGLTEQDVEYQQLMSACFENFIPFESEQYLLKAFGIAQTLWFAYESLAQQRLFNACNKSDFISYQRHGKLRDSLKGFITACQKY